MKIVFVDESFEDYNYFATYDKKVFKKLQTLIKDTVKNPFSGLGKPEPLKHNLAGYWSKRITKEHRLVYKIEDDMLIIISCRFHY